MQKIPGRHEEKTIRECLWAVLYNEMGSVDFHQHVENEDEKYPCHRCGYVDCVCTQNR